MNNILLDGLDAVIYMTATVIYPHQTQGTCLTLSYLIQLTVLSKVLFSLCFWNTTHSLLSISCTDSSFFIFLSMAIAPALSAALPQGSFPTSSYLSFCFAHWLPW
jgi:hypothetical protein